MPSTWASRTGSGSHIASLIAYPPQKTVGTADVWNVRGGGVAASSRGCTGAEIRYGFHE